MDCVPGVCVIKKPYLVTGKKDNLGGRKIYKWDRRLPKLQKSPSHYPMRRVEVSYTATSLEDSH